MKRCIVFVLSALCLTPGLVAAAGPAGAERAMQVSDAWVRAGPPGMAVLAGYMTITNTGDRELAVTKVSSPDFAMVHMHRTITRDGVTRMEAQEKLSVPAGGELSLAPGGLHLMLMRPNRALKAGDNVTLILHVGDLEPITVEVPVSTKAPHN